MEELRPAVEAEAQAFLTQVFVEGRAPSNEYLSERYAPLVELRRQIGVPADALLGALSRLVEILWTKGVRAADRVGAGPAALSEFRLAVGQDVRGHRREDR